MCSKQFQIRMNSNIKADKESAYQTPWPVAAYMASLLPADTISVLEPTPGVGNIVKALERSRYLVTAPDDFFLINENSRFDAVVMNPPFSPSSARLENAKDKNLKGMRTAYYFLNQCCKFSNNIIALVPWFTIIDSDVRSRFLFDFGLISVTSLPRKTFGYLRIQTCILQLQKGYKGHTELKIFNY